MSKTQSSFMRSALAVILAAGLLFTPQAATAANQTFANVKYVISTGGKGKQVKARLVLTDTAIEIHEQRAGGTLKELPYTDLQGRHLLQIQTPSLED